MNYQCKTCCIAVALMIMIDETTKIIFINDKYVLSPHKYQYLYIYNDCLLSFAHKDIIFV